VQQKTCIPNTSRCVHPSRRLFLKELSCIESTKNKLIIFFKNYPVLSWQKIKTFLILVNEDYNKLETVKTNFVFFIYLGYFGTLLFLMPLDSIIIAQLLVFVVVLYSISRAFKFTLLYVELIRLNENSIIIHWKTVIVCYLYKFF